ncbi:MAG: DNA-processing protein DprA [Chloroflexota bacterium]
MATPTALSDGARALILLCSSVVAARGEEARPFGPRMWAKLQTRLDEHGVGVAELLGMSASAIDARLGVGAVEADRIACLLARTGQLAFELDRLAARGIGAMTLADDAYPTRFLIRLGPDAPPVLFVAGDRAILGAGGVAIVGSRDVDPVSAAFAEAVAAAAAHDGKPVVSGGARGVDQLAMRAAFEAGGRVAGLLPEGIEGRLRDGATRTAVAEGLAVLASPYHPGAGFSAGAAMARNKLIYALSDVAVVVASAAGSGGTWTGAVEALEAGWVPVLVRRSNPMPDGNRQLIERGALPLDEPLLPDLSSLPAPTDRRRARQVAEEPSPYEQQSLKLVD